MHIYLYQYVYNTYDPARTEIISVGRGPFSRAVPVNFYKKKEFQIKTFQNEKEIFEYIVNTDKTILYATKKSILDPNLKSLDCTKIYQNLPPGVKYYNVNNWVERTPFWTLYECKGGINPSGSLRGNKLEIINHRKVHQVQGTFSKSSENSGHSLQQLPPQYR